MSEPKVPLIDYTTVEELVLDQDELARTLVKKCAVATYMERDSYKVPECLREIWSRGPQYPGRKLWVAIIDDRLHVFDGTPASIEKMFAHGISAATVH